MTTGIVIRSITSDEVDVLQRFMPSSARFDEYGRRTHSHAMRHALQVDGTGDYVVAWRDREPVAHLLLRWTGPTDAFLRDRGVLDPYIEGLAVRPDMQSKGIGTAMIGEAERRACERGMTRVTLAVGVENTGARRLYERLGYVASGLDAFEATWTTVDAAGRERMERETVTCMVKRLSG